ncbi:TOMM precursor leader peptide-binding protein [Streptomyces sp. NPDC059008]|uniref:TOMM precursor leader peptide-binding protein n=1 Tax=Streptomyces sp. NPDC059008 TaxID=3346693 RepID=UPI00369BC5CB
MRGDIAVVGQGLLAAAVRRSLEPTHRVVRTIADGARCEAVVATDDGPGVAARTKVHPYAVGERVPWLPVRVEDGRVLIGPGWLPGVPGCPTCAQRRRDRNRQDAAAHTALLERFGAELSERRSPLLTQVTATGAAAVVQAMVSRLRAGTPQRELVCLSLETGRTTTHPVLPDPLCPDCARLPDDAPESARITLRREPKPHPEAFRVRDLTKDLPELRRHYVDTETGVVRSVSSWATGGCQAAMAVLDASGGHTSNNGYGRGAVPDTTRASAVAEALERIGGQRPRGRRTVVRAAYADIADHAVDPESLGLYPPARYETPGFRFRPYHPDVALSWVWAYSFARAQPVLVPETVAYYAACAHTHDDGHGNGHGQRNGHADSGGRHHGSIVYETSNGCALGGSLTEAIMYGLLEVAERDAFLLTWYGRIPAPRLDLDSAVDRRIPLLAARIRHEFGYALMAFDCTVEQGIPAFWLMAVAAEDDGTRPKVLCGAAAHLLPEPALLGGMQELAIMLGAAVRSYDPRAAARLLADSGRVREMDDHGTLYGHPDAFDRLGFLPLDGPTRPIPRRTWPVHHDLTGDLAELVGRYVASGLDVLAVDQTSSEHRVGNFSCAKVIVPGTLPMTFGHAYRRDHGLPRILTVPRLLGHRQDDLPLAEVNPYPHPFP